LQGIAARRGVSGGRKGGEGVGWGEKEGEGVGHLSTSGAAGRRSFPLSMSGRMGRATRRNDLASNKQGSLFGGVEGGRRKGRVKGEIGMELLGNMWFQEGVILRGGGTCSIRLKRGGKELP